MIRIFAFLALAVLLAGCSRYHSRAQGPFATPKKEPPPPYGAISPGSTANKPIANQSPLGIASTDPTTPPKTDEPSLIPPKAGVDSTSDDPNAFPPFKRKPQPQPLPSPFVPKESPNEPPITPKTPGEPKPAKDLAQLKELLATAETAWKAVTTYEATLTRRELNPKGQVNSEVLLFQFRRDPMSIFTRNIGGSGKGREVVYNPGKHGDKMYIMIGEGDSPLAKAGFIAPPLSPDDRKVTDKARYSIRDAGFGRNINELKAVVAKIEAGKFPVEVIAFHGSGKRAEYTTPLVGITHKLRVGDDPLMPTGGTRQYFFDMTKESPSYGMPVLVVATDPNGKEAEYYLFEKVRSPANLIEADFNPARLGKK
jgi:hypothetical protein